MALTQLKRALWVMNELVAAKSHGISRDELNAKWKSSNFNDKKDTEIAERTFFRLINDLKEIFEVEIVCSKDGNQRYSVIQNGYSMALGMLCSLVTDNSSRSASIQDLMLHVLNGMDITPEEKEMINDIAFRINKSSFECGERLINAARHKEIKGADNAQWSSFEKYRVCIWFNETFERISTWVGVVFSPRENGNEGLVRIYIVNETQDTEFHSRLIKELDLEPGVKGKGDYWWFALRDKTMHQMTYVTGPNYSAIKNRVESLLSKLNAF
ncbi:MAG: hypothetical protein K2G53_06945 [Muribaculaceae bacterium]|nr:hypothetical protein [Muribaculaceae bacterium]